MPRQLDQRYPTWMLPFPAFYGEVLMGTSIQLKLWTIWESIRNIYLCKSLWTEGIVDQVRSKSTAFMMCGSFYPEQLNIHIWSLMMKEHLFQNPEGIFLPHRWWYHKQAKAMAMAPASFLVLYVTNSPAPSMTFRCHACPLALVSWMKSRGSAPEFLYIYSNGKQRRCTVTLFKQIYDRTHRSSNISMQNKHVWMEI